MKKLNIRTIAHISLVLNIFLLVWQFIGWLNIHDNGIWFGFAASIVASLFKELNDKFGWVKWLLSDGNTLTGFDAKMFWKEIAIPFVWICIYYLIYK